MSRQWGSREFVLARNRADRLIKSFTDKKKGLGGLYGILMENQPQRIDDWVDISLIAHFFVRLNMLIESHQIDKYKAGVEFKEQIAHWCANLKLIYDGFNEDEKRVSNALQNLLDARF